MDKNESSATETPESQLPGKEYIGDAVYVEFDGYHVWLTTGDGNNQRIALEQPVVRKFEDYLKRLRAGIKEHYGQNW